MTLKKTITKIIIIVQLLCVYFVYPKKVEPRAFYLNNFLSKICLNSAELLGAPNKIDLLDEEMILPYFEMMCFMDILPQEGKEYLFFLNPPPVVLQDYYYPEKRCRGYTIYSRKGWAWDDYKNKLDILVQHTIKNMNECYIVKR